MPEKKKIRIEKVIKAGSGGTPKKVVVVAKKGDGGEWVSDLSGDIDIDIDSMLCEEIEEEDENGHTVLKIRIPKRVNDDGEPDALVRAAGVSGAIGNLEGEITAVVKRAREQGYTWTQIGDALGVTKQAAWERFSGEE